MKFPVAVAILVAAGAAMVAGCRTAIPASRTDTQRELMQLEREWCEADIARDTAFFRRLLAEEFTGVGSRGGKDTKGTYIEGLLDRNSGVTACEDRDLRVRVYGDVAVVTGLAITSGLRRGIPYKDRQILFTNTYIMRAGRWQLVASHGTLAASQQQ